jgi:predicted ester cyclase
MSEGNKGFIGRVWNDTFGNGNLDAVDENFAADFVWLPPPGVSPDAEGFKSMVSMWRAAFSDVRFDFVDQVAEGDKVANRVVIRGTHQGEFAGVSATGKEVEIDGLNIMELRGGKIVAERGLADELSLLQQVGAILS